jgi:branched-chain amino acid transport system permease protein
MQTKRSIIAPAKFVRPTAAARTANTLRFVLIAIVVLAVFPFAFKPIGGYPDLAVQILLTGVAAAGFNLLLGYTGVLSYGHAAFYGGGSYVAAIVLAKTSPNIWIASLLAIAFTTALAFVIGSLVVRLYGIYFALLTVAFGQMIFFIVEQWRDVTGGDDGFQSIPSAVLPIGTWNIDLTTALPSLALGPFGDLSDVKLWYVFAAVVALLVILFTRALVASQFGEVLGAIRENEERSTFVGYDPRKYKLAAFTIAGALAGLSGALRAAHDGSVALDALSIERSGSFVIYTVIGGVQTILGPFLGTGIIMYLESVLSGNGSWRLIEGIIFVAVIVLLPGGILGKSTRARFDFAKALRIRKPGASS